MSAGASLAIQSSFVNEKCNARPQVLLAATYRWQVSIRLAIALHHFGLRVSIIGPNDPAHRKIDCLERVFDYRSFARTDSLLRAITSAAFDLVVPCDDRAREDFDALFRDPKVESKVKDLIVKSFGEPDGYAVLQSRWSALRLAEEAGLLVPSSPSPGSAFQFPIVIKADHTCAGDGVRIARNRTEYEKGVEELSRRPSLSKILKRWVIDRDRFYLNDALSWKTSPITLQTFIPGRPANRAVFCWKGKVLAGISVVALETLWPTGPSSIVEVIEHPDMDSTSQAIVKRLGASGFLGFDFILEVATQKAYLIEINPRATPTCHLSLGVEHDLCAAIAEVTTGRRPPSRPKIKSKKLAVFRLGTQPGLPDAFYSDAPSEYPDLVRYWRRPPGLLCKLTRWTQNRKSNS